MPEIQTKQGADHFEALGQSLNPHPSKAKILIEVADKAGLKIALNALQNMGLNNVEYFSPWQEYPGLVLLLVDMEDVKETVLGLSEAGFDRVKGINPEKRSSI